MKKIYTTIILVWMGCSFITAQEFDIVLTSPEAGTKTHQARNSITFGPNYSYTPSGGTMTAEIVNPVVAGNVSYNYTIVNPETRSLNTSYSVGTTSGSFNVNALGGATYTIPIDVAPGVAGLQPNLALTYNSLGGTGVAGYGWNINGISAITRSPQTYYHDGQSVGVDLTTTDRFSLDGQRLVCISGSYGENGSVYRTEHDIFSKVTCYTGSNGPDRFEVKTKSGLTCQYGYDNDADQTIDGHNETVSWYVNKITDVYGNEMEFAYIKDGGHNYLAEITYGPNTVTFFYKQRSDITTSYLKGSMLEQRLILEKIEVKYNANVVKKYEFKYNYPTSNYTRHSVLNEVIEYGIGSSRMNSTVFSYQNPDNVAFTQTTYNTSHNYISYKSRLTCGDFDGDGLEDIFTMRSADGSYSGWKLHLNNGNDYFTTHSGDFSIDEDKIVHVTPMDLNGDGKDDLIIAFYNVIPFQIYDFFIPYVTFYYAISSGNSFSEAQYIDYKINANVFSDLASPNKISGDFNGDGIEDCCIIDEFGECEIYSFANTSGELTNNFTIRYTHDFGAFSDSDKIFVSDFNGDGKTDIWISNADGLKIYSLIDGLFTEVYSSTIPKKNHHFKLGDFNGDGKTDMFIYGYDNYDWSDWQMRLSTGTGFAINYIPKKKNNLKNDIVRVGDFNGDGCSDLMVWNANDVWTGRYYYISKNQGTDLYSHFESTVYPYPEWDYYIADFDGDGRDDYLCTAGEYSWNGYQIFKSGSKNRIIMEKFTNGLNAYSKINYTSLSQASSSVYTKGTGASFPVFDYQGALPVVSSVLSDNGRGSQNTTNYTYEGAKIHRQGKGFLCYAQTEVTDVANDFKTKNNYGYNTSHYYPELLSVKQYADGDSIQSVYHSWDEDITATGIYEIHPVFPYILESEKNNILTGHSTTTSYDYGAYGNLEEVAVEYDNGVTETTTNVYDNNTTNWWLGRLTSSTAEYAKSGEPTISNTVTYTYSTDGKLKPDFIKYYEGTGLYYYKNHDYNSNGTLEQLYVYAPSVGGRYTNYTYEGNGVRVKTVNDPLGHETEMEYDPYGRLSSEEDYLGNVTSYTYDNLGRITTETQPDGFITTTTYNWGLSDFTNSCYSVQQDGNDGSVTKTWYDELAREIRNDVKGFSGSYIYTATDYNSKGQVYRISEPSTSTSPSQWNTHSYDSYGRITGITRPSGRNTTYVYGVGNSRVTETTGGKSSWKETDSQGLVTQAHDNGGDILYTYFPDGKVKTIMAPGGAVTTMEYNDAARNQTKLIDPSAGTMEYTYNAFGQLKTQKNARNQTTTYDYHADGRISSVERLSGEGTDVYAYNTDEQLTGISNSTTNVSRNFRYDTHGRIDSIAETIPGSSTFSTTFDYDELGRLIERTHPSGIVETNNYNSNGYLASISMDGSTVWTITGMNERQQITATSYFTGALRSVFGYDDYGYPSGNTLMYINTPWIHHSYSFDPVTGNLNWRKDSLEDLTESFTYDNLDRLETVTGPQNLTMDYAANGNILTKSDVGTNTFEYNHPTIPYALTDLETASGLVPEDLQTAEYTSFEQVSTIDEGDYDAVFTYNSDNQRCKMVVNENSSPIVTRWYAGSRYMKETAGGATKEYTWIGGDAYSAPLVAITQSGQTSTCWVFRDYLGNIIGAQVGGAFSIDSWGRRRNPDDWSYDLTGEPDLVAGRGFTGHEWLPWFNLYNMNGRLYDPIVGRFLSPDENVQMPDFSQNFNRYSYALNNPLKYNDPDGEIIFTLLAALIPGAQPLLPYAIAADIGWMTDYGMQVAMNYANKQEGWTGKDIWFKQIDWFDVGMSAVVSGATGGYGAELKAGKELGKFGTWVVKNSKLIYAGEIIATSAIDITGEGWQKVGMDDFGKRVAIGLTIYGINDIVGDYTKKWVKNPSGETNFEDYLVSGNEIDRNGLTRTGRALQKHGSRPNSIFPNVAGKNLNIEGQNILNSILNSPNKSIIPNRFGGYDIFDLFTGRGARFGVSKNFMGFLEP